MVIESRLCFDNIFLKIYIIVMMLGNFMSSPMISILHHGCAVLALAVLIIRKYIPSKFITLAIIYTIYLILVTFVVNGFTISIYTIINLLKIVIFIAFFESNIRRSTYYSIREIFNVVFILTFINMVLMFALPHGVLQTDVIINQWTTVQRAVWPLGNVNSMIGWYLLLIILLAWRSLYEKPPLYVSITSIVVAVLAIVRSQSSTSIVVIFLGLYALWIILFTRRTLFKPIKTRTFLIIYVVVFLFLIAGRLTVFEPIIEMLFGKDVTFSLRTVIWSSVLTQIALKPVFGWGYMTGSYAASILGAATFTSAHNQILNTLWQGGICGLAILAAVFLLTGNRISKVPDAKYRNGLNFFFFSILIELLFETAMTRFEVWAFVLICYMFANAVIEAKAVNQISQEKQGDTDDSL